jgi:uncharacterized membrane protein YhfC
MDVLARFLNGFLMLALPLGLGVFLARRLGQRWGLFGAGVVTFIGSQIVHLPFNALILNPRLNLGEAALSRDLLLSAALLGLSAGVFEELARYAVLRFWQREARSWRQALMFGAGHGGVESFLLGILVLVAFFQALAYRGADLTTLVPAEQLDIARGQLEIYWALPWPQAMLGALERLFALCIHLSLSVLVMRAFTNNNRLWLAAAIGWHTLVDAAAVISLPTLGAVTTEFVVGVLALISLAIVFLSRDEFKARTEPAPGARAGLIEQAAPLIDDTSAARLAQEKVDESRFTQS